MTDTATPELFVYSTTDPAALATYRRVTAERAAFADKILPAALTELGSNGDIYGACGTTGEPDRFTAMVQDGRIHPGMKPKDVAAEDRSARKERDEIRIASIAPAPGRHRTLVIDPPWEDIGGPDSAGFLGRAAPDYATMNQGQLVAIGPQVRAWLEPESHVYLWTINNRITDAHELAAAWGLDVKAFVTWCKPTMGLGSTFRNATEHFLFCSTGGLGGRATDIPTWFVAAPQRAEHSAKPKEFYDIVRRMSYPSYGECYQRSGEPDFKNVYQQVGFGFGVAV